MRLLALLSLLLPACGLVPGMGGQEGEDLSDSGIADSGTGTDSGSDSGSDDTDEVDSGDTAYEPPFTGPFILDAMDGSANADRCTGTIELAIDGSALTGSGTCTFAGALATSFPDGVGVTVEGTVAGDGAVSGLVQFVTGASGELAWTGTATSSIIVGSFGGDLDGTTPISVSGSFDAAR